MNAYLVLFHQSRIKRPASHLVLSLVSHHDRAWTTFRRFCCRCQEGSLGQLNSKSWILLPAPGLDQNSIWMSLVSALSSRDLNEKSGKLFRFQFFRYLSRSKLEGLKRIEDIVSALVWLSLPNRHLGNLWSSCIQTFPERCLKLNPQWINEGAQLHTDKDQAQHCDCFIVTPKGIPLTSLVVEGWRHVTNKHTQLVNDLSFAISA